MNKLIQTLVVVLVMFSLSSCDSNVVYSKFEKNFPNNRWTKENTISFDFTIEQPNSYELTLQVGHIHDYQIPVLDVEVALTLPDGTQKVIPVAVAMQDQTIKSDCLGDVCDLFLPITSDAFSEGEHQVSIRFTNDLPYLPNILGIGIQVIKSNL